MWKVDPQHRLGGGYTPSVLASAFLGVVIVGGSAAPARAGISFVDMFRCDSFSQTGNGNSLTTRGSFLSLRLASTGTNDYDTVQMICHGPKSPASLARVNPTHFRYQTGFYPSQFAMDTDFPIGTYRFTATGVSGTDTTDFDYFADGYPVGLPHLTGSNYTDLQGMNARVAFTFQFSLHTPHPLADEGFVFFTIFDYTANAIVFDAGFQPFTTTSLTLPANTLLPGRQYAYELIYSDRVIVPSPGAEFDAQIGFDVRTMGAFTTAIVPKR